jgi:hypothetical protein
MAKKYARITAFCPSTSFRLRKASADKVTHKTLRSLREGGQYEETLDCTNADSIKDFLMLSLPVFAEATPGLVTRRVR